MDFRAEWSSILLIALMVVMAYFIHPGFGESPVVSLVLYQTVLYPIIVIALACIPVVIVCYFIKLIPVIDYSIRVGFLYMLIMLIMKLIGA